MSASFKKLNVLVTGYGPFMTIKENPSDAVRVEVEKGFEEAFDKDTSQVELIHSENLVVEKDVVDECLQRLDNKIKDHQKENPGEHYLVIHLGVSAGLKHPEVCLERQCTNAKCFVSQNKYIKGTNDPICPSQPPTHSLTTPLPLNSLYSSLKPSQPCLRLSTDPGTYLCNYIYYQSLSTFSGCPSVHPLFIHVPNSFKESVIMPSVQTVYDLVRKLKQMLESGWKAGDCEKEERAYCQRANCIGLDVSEGQGSQATLSSLTSDCISLGLHSLTLPLSQIKQASEELKLSGTKVFCSDENIREALERGADGVEVRVKGIEDGESEDKWIERVSQEVSNKLQEVEEIVQKLEEEDGTDRWINRPSAKVVFDPTAFSEAQLAEILGFLKDDSEIKYLKLNCNASEQPSIDTLTSLVSQIKSEFPSAFIELAYPAESSSSANKLLGCGISLLTTPHATKILDEIKEGEVKGGDIGPGQAGSKDPTNQDQDSKDNFQKILQKIAILGLIGLKFLLF